MKIQINTDHNIDGNIRLESYINERIESKLKRFSDDITRIEVHLSDQNGDKFGKDDTHCRLEVRLKGLNPLTVLEKAIDINTSINGAIDKMKSVLETHFDKLKNKKSV